MNRPHAEIRLHGLGLRFPGASAPVVQGLDLTVESGSFVALVGASGVGKSTLLRIVARLLPPSDGVADVPEATPDQPLPVAMVFQDARLLPWCTARGNVLFGMERLGLSSGEMQHRARDQLEHVGLTAQADRWPRQLSGGQRQRVAIARALAVQPNVLLMDEPFGALDAITRELLQDDLARLHMGSNHTVLFVTHDISEAVHLADRVVLLGRRPAAVVLDVSVTTKQPRRRDDPDQLALATKIRDRLFADLNLFNL